MNIVSSDFSSLPTRTTAATAPKIASQPPSAPTESFTFSDSSDSGLASLGIFAGVALAGAAHGSIGSLADGYHSVWANAGSGAVVNAAGMGLTLSNDKSGYGVLAVMGGGALGTVLGTASGVGTNLLESFTGMPRLACGAISGLVANVAAYAMMHR